MLTRSLSVVIPCHCDSERCIALVSALSAQSIPEDIRIEIIVVDDCSPDGSADIVERSVGGAAKVLRLRDRSGCAGAREAGARTAKSDFILFLDSDCLPGDDRYLASHLQTLTHGNIASVGPIHGTGSGFWHNYQVDASNRRRKQHSNGVAHAGTGANLAVLLQAFKDAGGYDTAYRNYGFEDRDLLIRLAQSGKIGWSNDACIRHMDDLTLERVCRKMYEAGATTSDRFMHDHPKAYRQLGYSSIDVRCHAWLAPLNLLPDGIFWGWVNGLDRTLDTIPYQVARIAAKVTSAAAYLRGTSVAISQTRAEP